jgi:hypothetical protein
LLAFLPAGGGTFALFGLDESMVQAGAWDVRLVAIEWAHDDYEPTSRSIVRLGIDLE